MHAARALLGSRTRAASCASATLALLGAGVAWRLNTPKQPHCSPANDPERSAANSNPAKRPRPTRVRRANTRITPLDSVVVAYETRLRDTASLMKLFSYFNSVSVAGTEYMTPLDLVRAVTPGVPPAPNARPINIPLFESDPLQLREELSEIESPEFFRFGSADPAECGLIDFPRFVTFVVLLATPAEQIDVMYDMVVSPHFAASELAASPPASLGGLTAPLFEYLVSHSIKARNQYYSADVKLQEAGGPAADDRGDAMMEHLFGRDLATPLPLGRFKRFHADLSREVLRLEYYLLSDAPEGMTVRGFAQSVAALAPADYRARLARRAADMFPAADADGAPALAGDEPVSLDEYAAWKESLKLLESMETAVRLYAREDAHFTPHNLRRAAKAVARADLSPHVVRALFLLFDPAGSGELLPDKFGRLLRPHAASAPGRAPGPEGLDLHLALSCCATCVREWYDGTLEPVGGDAGEGGLRRR